MGRRGAGVVSTGAEPPATGKYRVKRLPSPGVLTTSTAPPWVRITPCTTARPRPVPWPTGLVVKKGSKMRCTVVASMPGPLSSTLKAT
ncbi:hypothetical protein D3C78_1111860 [compost metagenome]